MARAVTAVPGQLGVSSAVYAHDQLRKLEDILDGLRRCDLSLDQLDRFERAIVKAHTDNLLRLDGFGLDRVEE
jgi:hypothetical protein